MTYLARRPAAVLATLAAVGTTSLGTAPAPATAASVPHCLGRPATIVGSGLIHGTPHADVIVATRTGSEVLAGGGDDRVCGAFLVHGQGGDDRVRFGGGEPSGRLDGGPGDDRLTWAAVSSDIPELAGGPGADFLRAPRAGAQVLTGGRGPDLLRAGPGDDWVSGGGGTDTAFGGRGDDRCSSVERASSC